MQSAVPMKFFQISFTKFPHHITLIASGAQLFKKFYTTHNHPPNKIIMANATQRLTHLTSTCGQEPQFVPC